MQSISLILLVLAVGSDDGGETWPSWSSDYTKASNRSQDSGKPLLLVIDNPSESSLRTEHTQRVSDATQARLLGNFERCHVDVTTNHGKQVAEAFGVQRLPFVAIIDKTGERLLYRKMGKISMAEWFENLAIFGDDAIAHRYTAARKSRVTSAWYNGAANGNAGQSLCFT